MSAAKASAEPSMAAQIYAFLRQYPKLAEAVTSEVLYDNLPGLRCHDGGHKLSGFSAALHTLATHGALVRRGKRGKIIVYGPGPHLLDAELAGHFKGRQHGVKRNRRTGFRHDIYKGPQLGGGRQRAPEEAPAPTPPPAPPTNRTKDTVRARLEKLKETLFEAALEVEVLEQVVAGNIATVLQAAPADYLWAELKRRREVKDKASR